MFVFREARGLAFLAADLERHHFIVESSCRDGCFRFLLRTQSELVLFPARDFILARELLSGLAHQQPRKRIAEAVAIHAVDELHVAEARAPTSAVGEV